MRWKRKYSDSKKTLLTLADTFLEAYMDINQQELSESLGLFSKLMGQNAQSLLLVLIIESLAIRIFREHLE